MHAVRVGDERSACINTGEAQRARRDDMEDELWALCMAYAKTSPGRREEFDEFLTKYSHDNGLSAD
jgi:hypothetical protein